MGAAETFSKPGMNRLLAAVPSAEHNRVVAAMEPVVLEAGQVLYAPNQPISHVYFPLSSVASLLVLMEDGRAVEVGTVGNEGMVGLPVFLGATSTPGQALTQVPGDALRLDAQTFIDTVLVVDGPLYRVLHDYTLSLFVLATQNAACTQLHALEQRFCRWMLLTHDQVDRDRFPLAERFIAQMLAAGLPEVRGVIAAMERAGLVAYEQGTMAIRDRSGLQARSCECYGVIRATFERSAP